MARRKSRVTRRGRRKARAGTRKQSGGFSLNPLNWFKKTDPAAAANTNPNAAAVTPPDAGTPPAPADPAVPSPPTVPGTGPNAPPVKKWWNPFSGGGRKKSRKTRHRRLHRHRK